MTDGLPAAPATRTLAATPERLAEVWRAACDGLYGLDTETEGPALVGAKKSPNPYQARLVGFSVAVPDGASWYVPVRHRGGNAPLQGALRLYEDLLASDVHEHRVWVHNGQWERHVAAREGLTPGMLWCSMAATWHMGLGAQLHGGRVTYALKQLAREVLGGEPLEYADVSHGASFAELDPADPDTLRYTCDDAWNTLAIGEAMVAKMREAETYRWFRDVEVPFGKVLADMEEWGVGLDDRWLRELEPLLAYETERLAKRFRALSCGLSVSSPDQRRRLFEDGIWTTRGVLYTKTGKLQAGKDAVKNQLVRCKSKLGRLLARIYLRWAELERLRTGYCSGLVSQAWQHHDGRLHSSYLQTGTRTGRLSSSRPNLQNIPAHGKVGKKIRKALVARPGWSFAAADYSQIELRVLAHLCGRGRLLEAYQTGADVHQQTADLCGVPRDPHAKRGNFAYVYGAGAENLARVFGSLPQAEKFIKLYELSYPEVPALRARYVAMCEERGWVRTLSGRRRVIPGIGSGNKWERYAAQRRAFNTPIQGGARDLIAKAMVDLDQTLRRDGAQDSVKFSGQIHDDLILEARDEVSDWAAEQLRAALVRVAKLRVPLQSDLRIGKTWADLKG